MRTEQHHYNWRLLILFLLVLVALFIPKATNGFQYFDMPMDGNYNYRYLDEIVGTPIVGELIVVEGKISKVVNDSTLILSDGYADVTVKINNLQDYRSLLGKVNDHIYLFGIVKFIDRDLLIEAAEVTTSDGEIFSINAEDDVH